MNNKTYDWIVVGGGITGATLSYELQKQGLKVLLLEKEINPYNATYYSYGGLTQWWRTDALTSQLAQEGIEIQRNLAEELGESTEFREIPLILTINPDDDLKTLLQASEIFSIKPQYLDPQQACEIEPLLNVNAISGAFLRDHAHINPYKTNLAYKNAFQRHGGEILHETAIAFVKKETCVTGVITKNQTYLSENTVICAGGLSNFLLHPLEVKISLYFTHSYVLKTSPVEIKLRTLVMSAKQERLQLEKKIKNFNNPETLAENSIIDVGAIQFLDHSFCLGQISTINPNPDAINDLITQEQIIRTEVGKILPSLQHLPGKVHHCLVAFQQNKIALAGKLPEYEGIYLFSGFTSPLIFCPPLARHFARWVQGETSEIITQLSLN